MINLFIEVGVEYINYPEKNTKKTFQESSVTCSLHPRQPRLMSWRYHHISSGRRSRCNSWTKAVVVIYSKQNSSLDTEETMWGMD